MRVLVKVQTLPLCNGERAVPVRDMQQLIIAKIAQIGRPLPPKMLYCLLESAFLARSDMPYICQKYCEVAKVEKGADEVAQLVFEETPLLLKPIESEQEHEQLRTQLKQKKEALDTWFTATNPSPPSYHFALSYLLYHHLSRGIPLTKELKELWFDTLLKSPPENREEIYQYCVKPHYHWPPPSGSVLLLI